MAAVVFPALRSFAALLLVALNGLFVAAEFSLVKIRATQVDRLAEGARRSAGLVKEATGKLDSYLAVCQLGITISSLGLGALGEPAVAALIEPLLVPLGVEGGTLHFIAFVIGFSIISFLRVFFGELAPKTIAIQSSEGTSLFVAPFMMKSFSYLLPATYVFNGTANAFTRLLRYLLASESDETHSGAEIQILVAQSARQGMLERDEEGMIRAVFEPNDKTAREIMVPPRRRGALRRRGPEGAGLCSGDGQVRPLPGPPGRLPRPHSRGGTRQRRPAHYRARGGSGSRQDGPRPDARCAHDPREPPYGRDPGGFARAGDLQMAVVIDEWGSFEGFFTIEDIVGKFRDEFDDEEPAVRELGDGTYRMDHIPIAEVNEALGADFESQDFETVGGLVLGRLGRVREIGDEVSPDGYLLRVDEVDGHRVTRIVVRGADDDPESDLDQG